MDTFGQLGAVRTRVAQDRSRSRTTNIAILALKGLRRTLLGNRGLDPFWTLWSHGRTISGTGTHSYVILSTILDMTKQWISGPNR